MKTQAVACVCGGVKHNGPCGRCGRGWQARNRPTAHGRGYGRKWQALRAAHLQGQPLCVECGTLATVVDHIEPHRGNEQLLFDPANLQSLCRVCHGRKTASGA